MSEDYPRPSEEAMRDMVTCRLRHPTQCTWPDSVYQALYEHATEQLNSAAELRQRLEEEHALHLAVWQKVVDRACAALASGNKTERDLVTASAMALAPWREFEPIAIERAAERERKLIKAVTELQPYLGWRASEAARKERQAEQQAQEAANREAQREKFLAEHPEARARLEHAEAFKRAEEQRQAAKAARQTERERQLAEREAQADALVDELLSGPPKGKGK